ncbi:MAG: nucleotidyltransferase domain-containing protein [Lachnospiraceae bacterium]|nr:nucleotidyltransferase domain-containing protein [Lachnospiraceae bacterium]
MLFGSRASHSNRQNSDVDLIMEFSVPVSLITLAMIKDELEEMFQLKVDVIHGPITEDNMIEVSDEAILYTKETPPVP